MPLLPARWLYRRLGKAYPASFFVVQLIIGTLVTAGTVLLVTLFYPATAREKVTLLAITEALTVAGLTFGFTMAFPRLRPLVAWIAGRRDRESSLQAWDAAVNLPSRIFRRYVWLPCVLVGIPSVVTVVVVLDLRWTALAPLLVAGLVAALYAAVLQYFGIEIGMRPVVDDIVRVLPRGFHFERVGLPLRVKLLTILPLMSVITGLVVAALVGGQNLGLSVLITLAVAFSISLELTLLLSDSISRPMSALHDGIRDIERGEYDVQIPVTTSDDLGELTDGFNRMAAGLAERERLREAFGTYLDREVAEYILQEGISPAGVQVEVSILFCDVRDFTGFASDAESPEELVATLNRLFEAVVPVVARHGGHVDKFVGDGVLAVFGAPEAYADHADRALAAGCEMVEAVEGGAAGPLRVGVGINSGPVVAGSIGGAGRLNFSVIGDAVNVAARVEKATRETGDRLLITANTRGALTRTKDIHLVSRGEVRLKGKAEPIELFSVAELEETGRLGEPAARGAP
ncbi:MAG: adenylate/guanylate cyclase domain-containing protein [Solirubrobacteraceae bacterium]